MQELVCPVCTTTVSAEAIEHIDHFARFRVSRVQCAQCMRAFMIVGSEEEKTLLLLSTELSSQELEMALHAPAISSDDVIALYHMLAEKHSTRYLSHS